MLRGACVYIGWIKYFTFSGVALFGAAAVWRRKQECWSMPVGAWERNTWEGVSQCSSLSRPVYSAATLSMLGQL